MAGSGSKSDVSAAREPAGRGAGEADIGSERRSLLYRCIGGLVAKGWRVAPDVAHDLIGDFTLSDWPRLRQRFDPTKGSLDAYIASSFVFFAKRRLAELFRWQVALRDSGRLFEETIDPASLDEPFYPSDREAVAEAIGQLPPAHRRAILVFLDASGRDERAIARSLGLTRHRFRTLVADAFGRIVVRLSGVDDFEEPDREIATLLWRDGSSVEQISRRLSVSAITIQKLRAKLLSRLRLAFTPYRGR
jgi:DNA-directed RNA polymerase specialized sigma24 family protein